MAILDHKYSNIISVMSAEIERVRVCWNSGQNFETLWALLGLPELAIKVLCWCSSRAPSKDP